MAYVCPVCNSLQDEFPACPECHTQMDDRGRLMDFFDEYSAYLDIDGMKKSDGLADDLSQHLCPHIFACPSCSRHEQHLIEEVWIP